MSKKKLDTDALLRKFEENPTAFIAAIGGLLYSTSKIIDAVGGYRGSAAYAKDAARRDRNDKRNRKK